MKRSDRDETSEDKEKKPAKPKRRKRLFLISIGSIGLLIAILYMIPVNFYVGGYGNILSANDAVLRAGSKGPVRAILVQSGDRVKQDQVIIELEDDVELAEVDRCRQELNQSRTELQFLIETAAIEKQKDQFERDIAKIKYDDSQAEFVRVKGLRSSAATSDLELRMATAKRDMDLVDFHAKSIDKHKVRLAQVDVQKRKIATLEAQLAGAKRVLARRKIYAPMAGVLVMHTLSLGQIVDANEVLGQIFDDLYYQVVANIPEQFACYLKENQPVRVELSAYPHWLFDYFYGKTYWVSPVVNPQASGDGTVLIKAKIETTVPHTILKAGMAGKISVQAGKTALLWRILGFRTYDDKFAPTTQPAKKI
ncbi:MAG: efflux RND transporter periplasmic adaptor subunit [Phycisphaerae bacterium]